MKKITVLITMLMFAFSTLALSQPDDAKRIQKFMGKMNLTDVQKKDVEKIHVDALKQTIAQKAKLATARVELQQILKSDSPDKAAIEKKINEMADLGVQLHMIKVNSWFAVNKLLTADQQKTWKIVLERGPALQRHRMMGRLRGEHMPTPRPERPMPQ